MTQTVTFAGFRAAARALMNCPLTGFEGQFIGGLCFHEHPLTDKQYGWINRLLKKHDLPTLTTREP